MSLRSETQATRVQETVLCLCRSGQSHNSQNGSRSENRFINEPDASGVIHTSEKANGTCDCFFNPTTPPQPSLARIKPPNRTRPSHASRRRAYKPTLDEVRHGRVFPASNRHDAPLAPWLRVAVPVEVVDAPEGPGYAVAIELGCTQCKMVVVVDEEVFLPLGVGGPRG
jgi:hypothetical protein